MAGSGDNPFAKKKNVQKQLTKGDVSNQGRMLLSSFIHDRMVKDGFKSPLESEDLVAPETPSGPPVEHIREVGIALRQIGDDLDGDNKLQGLIKQIPPDAPRQTFLNVAREIFADGNYNWGRVVALFYFAYKMIIKTVQSVLEKIPVIRGIVEWVVEFIYEYLAPWIISRGGWGGMQVTGDSPKYSIIALLENKRSAMVWDSGAFSNVFWIFTTPYQESIFEYFGSTRVQTFGILASGIALAAFIYWKYHKS